MKMDYYKDLKDLISPILLSAGFTQIMEERHPEAFGSAFCIFEMNKIQAKIIWDGKEGLAWIDIVNGQSNPEWEAVSTFLEKGVKVEKEAKVQFQALKDEVIKLVWLISD